VPTEVHIERWYEESGRGDGSKSKNLITGPTMNPNDIFDDWGHRLRVILSHTIVQYDLVSLIKRNLVLTSILPIKDH
jgi:hypothetical protein